MGKFIEILAMALGGLSLFAVCFIGFAVMSGKPLSGVPGLGSFLEAPETAAPSEAEGEGATTEAPSTAGQPTKRRTQQVIESAIGVMPAFDLPSPFTQVQLTSLVDDLKNTRSDLALREEAVNQREFEATEKERTLNERFQQLDGMRDRLMAFESELDLREQEVVRDEDAAAENAQVKWIETATVFAELEPITAGQRLIEYDPEDAAKILRAMDPTIATEILTVIPEDKWKVYIEAYAELKPNP